MGNNPSYFQGCTDCPVENVSWNDVQNYLRQLTQRTGKIYRLPTEAEWEYAARAGTKTAFWTGPCVTIDQANYDGNYRYGDSGCGVDTGVYRKKTMAVGSFLPNQWGLYDTMGNVWEWTCSVYDQSYSSVEQTCSDNDITGGRVVRGGSWFNGPVRQRSAFRYKGGVNDRDLNLGFRLARSL